MLNSGFISLCDRDERTFTEEHLWLKIKSFSKLWEYNAHFSLNVNGILEPNYISDLWKSLSKWLNHKQKIEILINLHYCANRLEDSQYCSHLKWCVRGESKNYRSVNMALVLGKLAENTFKETCKTHKWA